MKDTSLLQQNHTLFQIIHIGFTIKHFTNVGKKVSEFVIDSVFAEFQYLQYQYLLLHDNCYERKSFMIEAHGRWHDGVIVPIISKL